ncbi:MAG: DUF2283 domain-containing protein [Burkholderiales bacterium]|nr:DUF2283 domain-containing protein [Anaerolineae bacterium]
MRIKYDQSADAMYITLNNNQVVHTTALGEAVAIDFDADDNIIGLELLWVSHQVTNPFEVLYQLLPKEYPAVDMANLPTEAEALSKRKSQRSKAQG